MSGFDGKLSPPSGPGGPGGWGPPSGGGAPPPQGPPPPGAPPPGPPGPGYGAVPLMPIDPGYYSQMKTHPLATTALALGISSFPVACCCSVVSLALSVGAVVCGILAVQKIKQHPELHSGQGIAVAGIVLGALALAASLGMFALGFGGAIRDKFFR